MATGATGAPSLPRETSHSATPPPAAGRQPALHTYAPPPPRQPSPSVQASPSTVQASPLPTPHPLAAGSAEGRGKKAEQHRMRSSIACQKCRRSKVRCVNSGVGTTCEACRRIGRQCEYPAAGIGGTPQRRESITTSQDAPSERLGEIPRKRKRVIAPSSNALKDSPPTGGGTLDPQLLTSQVWAELFNIFEQHFATDLPFLHPPTFVNRLRRADLRSPDVDPSQPLLLGFLALTAPFHGILSRSLQSRLPQRLQLLIRESKLNEGEAASEYYAEAAWALLTPETLVKPTLETTQALLMLAYQEWLTCKGWKCFFTLGFAIRCAQAIGLAYEDQLDSAPHPLEPTLNPECPEIPRIILKEVKRRTFWSCFILDNYFSCGKNRPQTLYASTIHIQLPCSQSAFMFGKDRKTMMLKEEDDEFEERSTNDYHVKMERRSDEDVLARYIRALDLFGDLLRSWSCVGGRRREKEPPWSEKSQFYGFERRLAKLQQNLPSHLLLNSSNTEMHESNRTLRGYVLIHAVHRLCSIALEREWLPFIAFRCHDGPQGPLDENTFQPPLDKASFWTDSARKCFKAAKEFNDLTYASQELGVLVQTPITAFATYTVVVCVLYCYYFPQMDQDNYLCGNGHYSDPIFQRNWTRAWGTLSLMRQRVPVAWNYSTTIRRLNESLKRNRKDYRKGLGTSPASSSSSSTNDGKGVAEGGGGLTEYKVFFEKDIQDFSASSFKKIDKMDIKFVMDLPQKDDDMSDASSPAAINSENGDAMEAKPDLSHPQSVSWNAVNHSAAGSVRADSEMGTPSTVNGHPNGLSQSAFPRSTELDPTPQPHGYHNHYTSPPTDNRHISQVHTYPMHAESAQRDSLNLHHHHPMGSDDMDGISASNYAYQQLTSMENISFDTRPELAMFTTPFPHTEFATTVPDNAMRSPQNTWMDHAIIADYYQSNGGQ